MAKKRYNPKSHSIAVYIPCWLIQIPNTLLSFSAKCLYGRLSQWCSEGGDVYRSYNQLAEEIGSTKRSICDYVKELKDCGLIDTFQPQKGGLNHFIFYDHPWMYEPINKNLCYKSEEDPTQDSSHPPTQNPARPHAESCATPTQNPARINIKEIKEIKDNINIKAKNSIIPNSYQESTYDTAYKNTELPQDDFFEEFWTLYPKKTGKNKTRAQWIHDKLDGQWEIAIKPLLLEQIAKDDQWKDGFIPSPFNYLVNELWTDEIVKRKKGEPKHKINDPESPYNKPGWMKRQNQGLTR